MRLGNSLRSVRWTLLVSLSLLCAATSAIGQTLTWTGTTSGNRAMSSGVSVPFTQVGTYTVTVDAAMYLSFAGVAGGGASGGTTHNAGSGGGGGGAATTGTTVFLIPGKTYTLVVGASGVGTNGDSTGGTGGQTKLTNTTDSTSLVVLNGGVGGAAIVTGGAGGTLTVGTNGVTGGAGGAGAIGNNPGYNGNAGGNAANGAGGGGGGAYNPTGSIGGDGGSGVVAGHAHNGLTGGTGGGVSFSGVSGEFGGGGAGTAGVVSGATVGINGQSGAAVVTFLSSCSYSLSQTLVNKPATTTSAFVDVTTDASCAWTASSNATWLTITSGASGTGAGTVNYALAANTSGIARVGRITVINQTLDINQATDSSVSPILSWNGPGGTSGQQTMNQTQTLPFTTVGTYTMTVNHAMTLSLAAVAGGGASGGTTHNAGSGGGGGGAATTGTLVSLVPGKTYTLIVGTRGVGTAGDSTGGAGAATTFFNTTDNAAFLILSGGVGGAAIVTGGNGGTLSVGSNGVTGGVGGAGAIGNNPGYNGNAGGNAANGAGGGGGGAYNPTGSIGGVGGNGRAAGHAASGLTGGTGGGMTFAGVSGEYGAGGGGTAGVVSGATTGNPGQNGAAVFTFQNVCDYNLSSTSVSAPRIASTGLIAVSTISACSWSASSNTSWLTIKSGASGSGTGTVTFATTTNTTGLVRSGTLLVANQLVVVTQLASSAGDPTPLVTWVGTTTSGSQNVRATPTVPFTAAGSYTLSVNVGMNLTFAGVAGGGASGGTLHNSGTGGGGGGAATTSTSVSLLPGKTYTLTVGAGGAGTAGDSTGGTGGTTSFTNTTDSTPLVTLTGGTGGMAIVTGGAGGTLSVGTNGVTGGSGGTGGAGSNPTYNGNAGGNATNGAGGGGGGAYNPNGSVGGDGGSGGSAGHAHNARTGGTGGGMTFAGVTGDFGGGGAGTSGVISGASTGNNGQNGAGVLTYVSSIPAAPSAPTTTCSFYFSTAATGLRSHTWVQSDCSNGLPLSTWTGVGQAQNGNGTSGQALCTPTTGSHNNPSFAGSTDASITCFFGPPTGQTQPTPSVTTCSFSFTGNATGWRTHNWVATDCSNGLPLANAVGLGYGQNGTGSGGTVDCSVSTGSHFNHATNDGSTTGTVTCTFVNPSTPPTPQLTFCEHFFPDTASGWRTYPWTAGDCSNDVPTAGAWAIGQALNGDGTPEQAYCSATLGGHFNTSPSTGRVRCLFENLMPTASTVLNWAGPKNGWQDLAVTPVVVLTTPGTYAVNIDTTLPLTFYGAAGGAGGVSAQNGGGHLVGGNGGAGGGGGAVTNGTSVTLVAGKNYSLVVGAGGAAGSGGFPTSLTNVTDNVTVVALNGGGVPANIASGGTVVTGSNGADGANGGSAGLGGSGLATAGGNGANQVVGAAGGGGGGGGDTGSGGANGGGLGGRGSGNVRAQSGSFGTNGSGSPGGGGAGAAFAGIPGSFGAGGGGGGGGNEPDGPGGFGGAGQAGVGIFSKNALIEVTAGAAVPEVGSGLSQTFAFQYGDTAGATDLVTVRVLFHPSIPSSYASTCFAYYTRATNIMSLANDAGTGYTSGLVGSGGTIQNSQCAINLNGGSVSTAGSLLTLTLPMTFTTAFSGVKNIYLSAQNATLDTGLQNRGGWTVPTPCFFSLSPQSATVLFTGAGGSFTFTTTPSGCGWAATSNSPSWLHTSASGAGAGTVMYNVDANQTATLRTATISVGSTLGSSAFTVTQPGIPTTPSGLQFFGIWTGSGASGNVLEQRGPLDPQGFVNFSHFQHGFGEPAVGHTVNYGNKLLVGLPNFPEVEADFNDWVTALSPYVNTGHVFAVHVMDDYSCSPSTLKDLAEDRIRRVNAAFPGIATMVTVAGIPSCTPFLPVGLTYVALETYTAGCGDPMDPESPDPVKDANLWKNMVAATRSQMESWQRLFLLPWANRSGFCEGHEYTSTVIQQHLDDVNNYAHNDPAQDQKIVGVFAFDWYADLYDCPPGIFCGAGPPEADYSIPPKNITTSHWPARDAREMRDRLITIGGEIVGTHYLPQPVTFYVDANYQGASFTAWDSQPDLGGFDNQISSIRIPVGKSLVIYSEANYGGSSLTLTADVNNDPHPEDNHDVHDLSLKPLNGSTWDDAIRSFKIY